MIAFSMIRSGTGPREIVRFGHARKIHPVTIESQEINAFTALQSRKREFIIPEPPTNTYLYVLDTYKLIRSKSYAELFFCFQNNNIQFYLHNFTGSFHFVDAFEPI